MMKKFLIQLSIFLTLFAYIDFALGKILQYGEEHAIGGKTERSYYINNKTHEDYLVFGSSRAVGHYVPDVFCNGKITMYNCGEDETGIICFYPKINFIKQRYTPKVIIYDVYYVDLLDGLRFRNVDFLKTLKTSYGKTESVDSIFWRYEPTSRFKMLSNLYRYNSTSINILIDNIRKTNWYDKGFYLLNTGTMKNAPVVENSHKSYLYDEEKLQMLEKFIVENKDKIQLFFAISPEYGKTNDEMYHPIKQLCKKYNVPLLNHYCDTTFTLHQELFANQNHLNCEGALKYSSIIKNEIQHNNNIDN